MSEGSSGKRTLAFIFGLLIGALLGGGLGLLFAPSKGEETRKKLKRSSEGLKDKVDELYDEVRKMGEPLLEAVEDLTSERSPEGSVEGPEVPSQEPSPKERISAVLPNLSNVKKRYFKNTHH